MFCRRAIRTAFKNRKRAAILTTHYMEEAAGANRIIIIDRGRLRASGTPFELKEKYACDTVKFYCDPSERACAEQYLSSCGAAYRAEDYGFSLSVKNTTDSIDHINSLKEHITGFEVIQGTMDDVFLNACGKELKGENDDAVL